MRGGPLAQRAAAPRPLSPAHAHTPSPFNLWLAGVLVSADSYMNFQLGGAEEWIEDKFAGKLGDMLIRCNNVLHLREVAAVAVGAPM